MEEQFQLIGTFQYSAEAQILKGNSKKNIMVFVRDNHTIDSNPLYSQLWRQTFVKIDLKRHKK
jgi:hypothetical protein